MASANERLQDDAIAHLVDLSRYSSSVVVKIIGVLNRSDVRLAAELAAALAQVEPSSFTLERLESLLYSVRSLNRTAYEQVDRELTAELRDFANYEASYQTEALRSALPQAVRVATVTGEQAYAAALSRPFQGALLKGWIAEQEAGRAKKIRQVVAQGFVENKTNDQIIREIRGTKAKGYKDGVLEISRRDAEAVVRTAVSHMAGTVQDRVAEANTDLIKAVRWCATLDIRTSSICRIRDGLRYEPVSHKPIGHKLPWLAGPGRAHWRAVVQGTQVMTSNGPRAIEDIAVGDEVLTHRGRLRRVLATRSKLSDSRVVRVVHTQSGRKLRATDDHPILAAGQGWKFVGALEVGDQLFGYSEGFDEVGRFAGQVSTESEDGPTIADEPAVALRRAIKLVSANIDLEGSFDIGPCEVDDGTARWVLCNPERVEADQCLQHHLLALAQALSKCGCNALRQVLSGGHRQRLAAKPLCVASESAAGLVGVAHPFGDSRHPAGVALGHALGVQGVSQGVFLGAAEGPVVRSSELLNAASLEPHERLLGLVPDRDAVLFGEVGEATVGEAKLSLNQSQGLSLLDVVLKDDSAMVQLGFVHDEVISLAVQEYGFNVYDLEVEEDASYVASGVVVSNCRSAQVMVTKSWAELSGIEGLPEFTPSERASMDGAVPADLSYGDWLKKQSAARQDDVLGATRGKLLRDGGLSLEDMYSAKGSPLTLDEMRRRDAEAFKRAGL